uniref:Uncharacterized protein n=1 Tax=Enterobacter cloacae TaxID=550 RepID=A0A1V0M2K4_ENTCL|nr:Hypothetical protein [Enterobacter cloacae]
MSSPSFSTVFRYLLPGVIFQRSACAPSITSQSSALTLSRP